MENLNKIVTYKYILIALILITSCNLFSQKKDSIIYIVPDKVEKKLYEQIQKYDDFKNRYFEFYLESISENRFIITFAQHKRSSIDYNNFWANNTNRFILINQGKYPLQFDYDSYFGAKRLDLADSFGNREGSVLRSIFIYEGYNISFDKDGKHIEEDNGLYIQNGSKE